MKNKLFTGKSLLQWDYNGDTLLYAPFTKGVLNVVTISFSGAASARESGGKF